VATKKSQILEEIRQRKPLPSRSAEALLGLMKTADLVNRRFASVVEPAGISGQQYNVLRILRGSGKDGLPTLEVASRLIEQTPGITRLLDRLEAKKWIRRERCPRDRRQVLCWITPSGLDLLAGLEQAVLDFDREVLGQLSGADLRELIRILDRIRKLA